MTSVMSCRGVKIQYRLSTDIFRCTLFGPCALRQWPTEFEGRTPNSEVQEFGVRPSNSVAAPVVFRPYVVSDP